MEQNYLAHWGIKGMKWGVRRFQNKDGSLTPAGRKRYDDYEESKARKQTQRKLKKGRFDDMSDEDLVKAINRARLEDTYRALRPEQVSAGKKFTQKVMDEFVIPTAKKAGQNFVDKQLDKIMDKVLGVKPDELAALKKEFDILDYKSKIDEIKTGTPRAKNWDEMQKKQAWEKAKNDTDTGNSKKSNTDSGNKNDTGSSNSKKTDTDRETINVTPDMIFGKGTSSSSYKTSGSSSKNSDVVIDVYDFVDKSASTTVSNVSPSYISAGESFVAGLLEAPKN